MAIDPNSPFLRAGRDIRLIAKRQRWVIWLVVAQIVVFALSIWSEWAIGFMPSELLQEIAAMLIGGTGLGLKIWTIVGVILLMRALRTKIVVIIICAILMIIPLVGLIILLWENRRATRTLREAGLRVGFMGVKDEAVVKHLATHLCRQCGYDLTGNVSGRCPECGTPLRGYASPLVPFSG